MATVREKIPYYCVKNGVGYWQPPKWAREAPFDFSGVRCGPDSPDKPQETEQSRAEARRLVVRLKAAKAQGDTPAEQRWPRGSFGAFFEKWITTPAFARKAPRTREEFHFAFDKLPEDFRKRRIDQISPGHCEKVQVALEAAETPYNRWRTIKKMRGIFNAAVSYQILRSSPATTLPNPEPAGRSALWFADEVETLMATARDDLGDEAIAIAIELLWETMMSPVDVRTLSVSQLQRDAAGFYIERARTKTAAAVVIDIPEATSQRLQAYIDAHPDTLPTVPILRDRRNGKAFRDRHEFARAFREVRDKAYPGDKRVMLDFRRSGNVEADLGGASAEDRASILANTLHKNKKLDATYTPPTLAKARELRKQRELGREILKKTAATSKK